MSDRAAVATALALGFLTSPWHAPDLVGAGERVLGGRPPWLARLVRTVLARFGHAPNDDLAALRRAIEGSRSFRSAYEIGARSPRIAALVVSEPSMGRRPWHVPELCSSRDLAAWLGISDAELSWFADLKGINAHTVSRALHNYVFRWFPKRRCGYRLLEAPKSRLKAAQRRILREVLDAVPAHEAAHGFVRGRSVLSLAEAHSGQVVVLRMDLEEFFASVGAARIRRTFRALGYPEVVARLLTGLTTTATPDAVLRALPNAGFVEFRDERALAERARLKKRLTIPHLPQGAPTSPALANLVAFGLDLRLAHAAEAVGARYGRYADDLAFSGGPDFARRVSRFESLVGAIAIEQGFRVNHRKTRVMRSGSQQRLLGLAVNREPGVPRAERERLEAILTNAVRYGIDSQNRDQIPNFLEHLRGRVGWVQQTKPAHAFKLRRLLAECEAASATALRET